MDATSRLEVVKWWRERQERGARRELDRAQAHEDAARAAEAALREGLHARPAGRDAALFALADLSRAVAEPKLRAAELATKKAVEAREQKAIAHRVTAQAKKVAENLVDAAATRAREEEQRQELKALDELALNAFARR